MELGDVLSVITLSHVTVWMKNSRDIYTVVARGSINRNSVFDKYLRYKVIKISALNYKDFSITIEKNKIDE